MLALILVSLMGFNNGIVSSSGAYELDESERCEILRDQSACEEMNHE